MSPERGCDSDEDVGSDMRHRQLGLLRSCVITPCCGGEDKIEPDIIVISSDRIRGDGHKLKYKKFLLNIRKAPLIATVVKSEQAATKVVVQSSSSEILKTQHSPKQLAVTDPTEMKCWTR